LMMEKMIIFVSFNSRLLKYDLSLLLLYFSSNIKDYLIIIIYRILYLYV
jgi:hypothetical protein